MVMENDKKRTVIADDVEITGTIKCASAIELGGKLNGDMNCSNSVTIGASATVKGNLTVDTVIVMGQVEGNITAKDKIDLKSTARVNGDIRARRLAVEDGVTFIGRSEVNPSGTRPAGDGKTAGPETPPSVPDSLEDANRSKGLFGKK